MVKYLVVVSCLLAVTLAQQQQQQQQQNRRQYYQPQQQQQQQQQQQPQQKNYQQKQQQYQNDDDQYQDQPQKTVQIQPKQQVQQQQDYQPRQHHESTTYIPIIRFDKEQGSDGSYKAAWETGNNIIAQEEGYLKSLGPNPDEPTEELNAQVQQGSYSYTSPEGQVITVHYTADEFGFHPTGDHLPTPPPVSPEVQKGLDLIYAGIKQQQVEVQKGLDVVYAGIKATKEQAEREAQNPSRNQHQQQQQQSNNNNGQYRQ